MHSSCIIKPYLTEKTMTVATRGWFTFVVRKDANKAEIAQEIAKIYKVTVVDVRTINVHGKMKRVGKRQQTVLRQTWKKAMVELKEGQTIDAFQLGGQETKV
ncbi:MAG: 50S ribosomal protein L23 [Candidatus Gottesmanbacteria bacterium]